MSKAVKQVNVAMPEFGVSPFDIGTAVASMDDIDPQAVIAAEEFRVNTLISKAGFDTSDLRDGSESTSGERVAQRGDWNGAVLSIGAMAGTKAAADFLRGVKKIDPEWGKALREIEKAMIKLVRRVHPRSLGDITPTGEGGIARGFETWTRQIAEILRVGLDAGEPSEDGEGKEIDAEEIKEKVRSGKRGASLLPCCLTEFRSRDVLAVNLVASVSPPTSVGTRAESIGCWLIPSVASLIVRSRARVAWS